MKRVVAPMVYAAGIVCALLLLGLPANAQALRTWISGVGDDVNPCSRTAPCATLGGAIAKTATYGEINCLDPSRLGTVTITRSITLDCHEVFASIQNAGTAGITVNFDLFQAGDTQKTVRIRNINFSGVNSGTIGIHIVGANTADSAVFIEDCVIDGNFANPARGISDERSGGGELYVTNTTVRNMGAAGIAVIPAGNSNTINVSINNVRVQKSNSGLLFNNGVNAMVNNSVFSGNKASAIEADAVVQLNIDRSVISGNGTGIAGNGTINISNSDVTFNASAGSGTVNSYTNNRFFGNATGGTIAPIGSATSSTGEQ